MKPPPFEYYAPTTVEEALVHLAEHGYDAKPLAGGQSLIPMMNFRLAQPAVIVDLNNIEGLSFIRPEDDGSLAVGAMTRHQMVEKSELIVEKAPLVHETMPQIATSQIRSRGTFGGSLAHADPSAELVCVSVALDGEFKIANQSGERWVPAKDFFLGLFTSVLEPEELLVEIKLPPFPERTGWSLKEIARRPHDFCLIGVAAVLTLDENNKCQGAKLVYLSAGDGPVEATQAAELLKGQDMTDEAIRAAAEKASAEEIDPSSDIHATAEFRRHLANVLTRRALKEALDRAKGN
ncbi:MAG: xanthine dehydrogenase family protein subunit M [Anaerolineales bacterium]|nr:xanthine dehydrogenase family protein subunit M [Chloroflexota bacterium]MBL6982786.1 xanthine dehydrogenase family protein subunit M [Anaerolineales bacterium]